MLVQSLQLFVYLNEGLPVDVAWAYAVFLAANCVSVAALHLFRHRFQDKYPFLDEYTSLM